jgi:signal transduction histidine kinase/DNA-binding response OmpR family regulator
MTSASKASPRSVKRKILAGFLLASVAIVLAFAITQLAFKDMLAKVEDLSMPSGKIMLLNRTFQEITTLDQLQRAEAIRNPQIAQGAFLNHTQRTINLIDSMLLMNWNSAQQQRISSMKVILKNRDSLFFSYLKLKSNLVDNKTLTKRIDTLSSIIEMKKIAVDSNVITTEKKTTTTYVRDTVEQVKDERNFFGKIFGSKKKKPASDSEKIQIQVQEELSVSVDTVAIARQHEALEEVEKIVHDLENDRRAQGRQLLSRELELINANSLLVAQMLTILREVEKEELKVMQDRSYEAGIVVSESIKKISLLLLAFFLGAAVLVYFIWLDISRSNYYRTQLEKARDEAEELSQIKQRFLANMSHEIRTPLQSIIGFAEHIRKGESYDKEAVEAIYSSSEHLLHIVNEVLDYSRISSGHFTLAMESFELMDVVREVDAAMRIQADKKKLSLMVDVEQASNYSLVGDSFRLRQILYNVLGNAIKFTTKGFVKLAIKTEVDGDKVNCVFEIMDTGIGISKDDLPKIFNQFEQANASIVRNFGGTGLGLTIVKSLIEAQGGNLRLESTPGRGSIFTISIPFVKSGVAIQKETHVEVSENNERSIKLLVVDDDPMILRLCGIILKKNEIDHRLFDDPEDLLNYIPDPEVTHLLMDIRMPKINGVDLCRALRKKYPKDTKFVALTAHVFEQDKKELRSHGFDIVLTKPFHEEELLKMLGVSALHMRKQIPSAEPYTVDLGPLRQITMNDEALFQSVVSQFKEETEHDLVRLEAALSGEDKSVAREIFHKFAGRIGQMGVPSLSMKFRELESRIVKGEELGTLTPITVLALEELHKLLHVLRSEVVEKTK